ncbi:MAG TPA: hypothetical protein VGB82_27420 [Alphaproteobacteria bacterium]
MRDVKQNQDEPPSRGAPTVGFTLNLSIIESRIDAITAYVVWSFVALGDMQREFVAGATPDLFRDSWLLWPARPEAELEGQVLAGISAGEPETVAAA